MAMSLRYTTIDTGAMEFTGNTMGLSAGGGVDVLTSLNTNLQVPGYPAGTTRNYLEDGSMAILEMTPNAKVLYAELIWSAIIPSGVTNPEVPVQFTLPTGQVVSVTPDPLTAEINGYYYMTANVTDIVAQAGAGQYSVEQEIAKGTFDGANWAGWTLGVVYRDTSLPYRDMTLWTGLAYQNGPTPPTDVPLSGFVTPTVGVVDARVLASAQEGDYGAADGGIFLGPDINNLTALSGPNNNVNDFFASQINYANSESPLVGQLNPTGTFGTMNLPLQPGQTVGRQGWDITNVNGSGTIPNNSTTAVVRIDSPFDGYFLNLLGLQIDMNAPKMAVTKSVDLANAKVGDVITYTVSIVNTGTISADNVVIVDAIPNGLVWVPGSTTPNPNDNPNTGVNIGTVPNDGVPVVATYKATVTNIPAPNPIENIADINYNFIPGVGLQPINGSVATNKATTQVSTATLDVVKKVDKASAAVGDTLTYTITVTNTGNVNANSVVISDPIPSGTSYVPGSVNSDVTITGDPTTTINFTNPLAPGATATITYQVKINSLPVPNPIPNTAVSNYNYIVDPNAPAVPGTNTSNTVTTSVGNVVSNKTVDKAYVDLGDTITYTVTLNNQGISPVNNVLFKDALPNGVVYADSLTVSSPYSGTDPMSGITITTIGAGQTVTISWKVTVGNAIPNPNPIVNIGNITLPNGTTIQTNPATTQVNVADISVVKSINPNPVVAGELATYKMIVTNAGPSDAINTTLSDTIPPCVLNPEYSLDGGTTWIAWTGSIVLGTIVSGNSLTVLIRGTIDPSCSGSITNTAIVDSTTADPNPGNNTSTITTQVNTSADLSIVKSINPNTVVAGELATYTMLIANAGPSDAINTTLSDAIPSCVLNPEYSLNGGTTWSVWPGTTNLGTIASGNSVTVLIRGTIDSSCSGSITNTAIVDSTTADPNPGNNTSTITTQISALADLSIVKSVNPDPLIAGQLVTYTMLVSNAGPSDAIDTTLSDVIPACILDPEYSLDGGTTWNVWTGSIDLGTIVPDVTLIVLIRGAVKASCSNSITNTAVISSITPDPNPNNNTSTITTQVNMLADLSIVKNANPLYLDRGNVVQYTLTINNAGPSNALNVSLADSIPSGILNPEISVDNGTTWLPWITPYDMGILPPKTTVIILIRGTISEDSIGTIKNTAVISSTTQDPNLNNNTSTVNINVNYADLVSSGNFVKSVDKAFADIGDILTYTISITNTGNMTANNVVITDKIPTGTSLVPGSVTATVPFTGSNPETGISLTNGIAPGQTVLISFKVVIDNI